MSKLKLCEKCRDMFDAKPNEVLCVECRQITTPEAAWIAANYPQYDVNLLTQNDVAFLKITVK